MPVIAKTDVLVVGGGPAGLAAAIGAAREGMKTILVERYGFLGGMITQAMVGTIAWYRYAKTIDCGGILKEFEIKAKKLGATINNFDETIVKTEIGKFLERKGLLVEGTPTYEILDTECFKFIADDLIQESGVNLLLHCGVFDCILDGNTIIGVIAESKSGRQAILAKRVIDATGDADIAYFSGAPYRKDDKQKLMPVTTNFGVSGVDIEKFLSYTLEKQYKNANFLPFLRLSKEIFYLDDFTCFLEPLNKSSKDEEIPEFIPIKKIWSDYNKLGIINSFNGIHIANIDCTNMLDLTKAELEGRKRAIEAINSLKERIPGFEKAKLKCLSMSLGIRESRKIIGQYNITEFDVRNQARFEDSIGICPEFLDAYGSVIMPTTGRYFHIPYGITLPMKVENLLVAGRCVAGDKISHSATRQMVCCIATGQGTGVAAAVSIKEDVTCREVNISKVQASLENQGVRII